MYKVKTVSFEVMTAAVTSGEAETVAATSDEATSSGDPLQRRLTDKLTQRKGFYNWS